MRVQSGPVLYGGQPATALWHFAIERLALERQAPPKLSVLMITCPGSRVCAVSGRACPANWLTDCLAWQLIAPAGIVTPSATGLLNKSWSLMPPRHAPFLLPKRPNGLNLCTTSSRASSLGRFVPRLTRLRIWPSHAKRRLPFPGATSDCLTERAAELTMLCGFGGSKTCQRKLVLL